jgi:hypothetical protein
MKLIHQNAPTAVINDPARLARFHVKIFQFGYVIASHSHGRMDMKL